MLDLIIFVVFIFFIGSIGSIIEKSHYKKIKEREINTFRLPVLSFDKNSVNNGKKIEKVELVCGSVVLAADNFKAFLYGLKNIFGGRITPYEAVLDRARREAILRMKEKALDADVIVNLKIETSNLSDLNSGKKESPKAGVIAYGTAITYAKS